VTAEPDDLALAERVVTGLITAGETIATCESLTGGLIATLLTSVPGSSETVRGGLVTYAADLKTALAGVPAELIAGQGVVSRPVAIAMAVGARRVCQSDWAVAVTGVAGPGPSEGVPAGVVWMALAGPGEVRAERLHLDGDRAAVRRQVARAALHLVEARHTGAESPVSAAAAGFEAPGVRPGDRFEGGRAVGEWAVGEWGSGDA
jgi:nicotinamide-nucleotide amidase